MKKSMRKKVPTRKKKHKREKSDDQIHVKREKEEMRIKRTQRRKESKMINKRKKKCVNEVIYAKYIWEIEVNSEWI